jgi:hypothetical protein
VKFKRWLVDDLKSDWLKIKAEWVKITLNSNNDGVKWRRGKSRHFTVKSVYNMLTTNEAGPNHAKIWKGKVPNKIKIFLWLITNNAILTKDNLIRRKWNFYVV